MRILCAFGRYAYGDPARGEGYEYANFLPALRLLGHETMLFDSFDRSRYQSFAEMNAAFLAEVERSQPDLVLCALMSYELWTETLDLVRDRCRAALVNWGTDDSWKYQQFARFVAPHVDCYATTSRQAWRSAQEAGRTNWVLTQWAASDTRLQEPLPADACRYPVSFVGSAYGNRRRWIETLRKAGIEVTCFGHGWPGGAVAAERIPTIIRESAVSLNFGDSGLHVQGLLPYRSRQIKARIFEVPGAGGMLLTEHAPGIERFYRVGEEIDVFGSAGELLEKIRRYLSDPELRDRVAQAGHGRTRREHTYTRRFTDLLEQAIALKRESGGQLARACRFDDLVQTHLAAHHRMGPLLKLLRALLVVTASLALGRRRGPRAARRLLFELSWRFAGSKTYGAAGLPGRLFYRES
jgi:spore maturation protein CgeB